MLGIGLLSTNLRTDDATLLTTSDSDLRAAMANEINHGLTVLLATMQHNSKASLGFGQFCTHKRKAAILK